MTSSDVETKPQGDHFFCAVLMPAELYDAFCKSLPNDDGKMLFVGDYVDRDSLTDEDDAVAMGTGVGWAMHRAVIAGRGE